MSADLTLILAALTVLAVWAALRRCPLCHRRQIDHHTNAIGLRICRKCYGACPGSGQKENYR